MHASPADHTNRAPRFGPWRDAALGLAVLFCGTVLLCLLIYNNDVFARHMTSSDSLLPTIFIWDVLNHDYAWRGFQIARIPSFVPELALVGILTLALHEFRWVLFTYSVLQSFAFFVLAGLLVGKVTRVRALDAANFLLIVVTIVLAVGLRFPPLEHHRTLFTLMEHFGAFLLSITALLLTLPLLDRWRWPAAIGLVVGCFVSFLSTRLFALDYGFPLAAGLLILYLLGLLPWRRGVAIAACAGAGFVLAPIADRYLVRQPNVAIENVPQHLAQFVIETAAFLKLTWVSTTLSLALPLVVLTVATFAWLRGRVVAGAEGGSAVVFKPDDTAPIFLWVFTLIAIVGVIAICASIFADTGAYRYLTALLFWPLIWASGLLLPRLERFILPMSWACPPLIAVAILATAGPVGFIPGIVRQQNTLANCLVAQRGALGLKAGLAEYWIARPAMVASGFSVQVDQVTNNGDMYYWGNDRFWYERSFENPAVPPQYNFIVMQDMIQSAVKLKYGEPDRVAACDSFTIWIYNDATALRRKLIGNNR